MKSRPILLLAGIVAALISSAAERTLLFSDDFASAEDFADHWQPTGHGGKSIQAGGGCVKFPKCGKISSRLFPSRF